MITYEASAHNRHMIPRRFFQHVETVDHNFNCLVYEWLLHLLLHHAFLLEVVNRVTQLRHSKKNPLRLLDMLPHGENVLAIYQARPIDRLRVACFKLLCIIVHSILLKWTSAQYLGFKNQSGSDELRQSSFKKPEGLNALLYTPHGLIIQVLKFIIHFAT